MKAGDVVVWCRRTESLSPADVERMAAVLSADERDRQRRFLFERDRRDFTAAHALLRQALSSCAHTLPHEWGFERSARGKPHLGPHHAATSLEFNLSHTHGLVACAVARAADVGVDVERIGRVAVARDVASQYFSEPEVRLLEGCAVSEYATRFIELWTLKEAYIKAVGAGLHLALDSFAFAFEGTSGLHFSASSSLPEGEFLLAAPSSDTRLAVAVLTASPETARRFTVSWAGAEDGTHPRHLRSSPGLSIGRGI